jgi:hypothetical protein
MSSASTSTFPTPLCWSMIVGHDTWVSEHVTIQVVASTFVLSVPLSLSVTTVLRGKSHMNYLTYLTTNIT